MNRKKELRLQIKKMLQSLSKMEYEQQSFEIARNLYEQEEWKQAKMIGITISISSEVNTYPIIRRAWLEGKSIAVPKCFPKENVMHFYELKAFTQLENVFRDLYEPNLNITTLVKPNEMDCLIVPGLAFNKSGYRLGFGGGYYDRYLVQYNGPTVSLAFDCQIIEDIPKESHDLPVSKIITNKDVILTNG